jgi:hypothetical protein
MSSRLSGLPPATCRRRWKNWPSRVFHTERIGYSSMTAARDERVVRVIQ